MVKDDYINGSSQRTSSNEYDDLGRIASVVRGATTKGGGTVSYKYNLHGQSRAFYSQYPQIIDYIKKQPTVSVKLLEYALGGMDQKLFVSTYQLQLPRREELESFIEQERRDFNQV